MPQRQIGNLRVWTATAIVFANLLAWLFGASALLESREHYRARVEIVTANYAEILEARILEKIRVIDDALLRLQWEAERELRQGGIEGGDLDAFIERQTTQLPEVLGLRATDAEGTARWGKDVKAAGGFLDLSGREHFQAFATGGHEGLYIAKPFLDKSTQQWALALARAYRHPDGRFAGMVGAGLRVSSLTAMMQNFDVGRAGSVVLRHADTGLIARYPPVPGEAGLPGHSKVSAEFKALIESGKPVAHFHTLNTPDGIERTYAFRRLPTLPMTLAVGMARDEYLAPWHAEALRVGLLLITFTLTTLISAWLIRRYWQMRQQSEAALAEREQLMRAVFDQAEVGIELIDTVSWRFVDANLAVCRMLGYTREEMIGMPLLQIQAGHLGKIEDFEQAMAAMRETRQAAFENRHLCKDGRVIDVFVTLRLIQQQGRELLVGVWQDITSRKNAESELVRYHQHLEELVMERTAALTESKIAAEASTRAKSTFLANMSHEIRTPLNAITGMAHILRRSGLTVEQADKLDKIENAGSHLLRIINDVLDLSKIEAGKFLLEDAPVHIEALLGNVASMLAQKAGDKGLRFNIRTTALPHKLRGDPTRLQQALLNYAVNAIKFTERGEVTLRVTQDAETDETVTLRFEVEDTGIGISPEALPRLFNAFEQADNSTTRQYGGTGLGLAITKKIAEVMGGTAGASSTEGRGSTFWFTAVLQKTQDIEERSAWKNAEAAEQVIQRKHAGKRVLLTEDEPINREIAQMMLEDVGLTVDLAEDGREAVEKAGSGSYALILMDMQMPVLDGLDATRQIRQLPGHEMTPILAMTANAFAEDKDRCFAAGMDDFLTKPAKPEILYLTLLKWLENSKP